MKIKQVLEALREFNPILFMGSEQAEVTNVVEDYQSVYEPEGIHVLNSLSTKGSKCAPTIITSNAFLGLLPSTALNVITVDLVYLDQVYHKLNGLLA